MCIPARQGSGDGMEMGWRWGGDQMGAPTKAGIGSPCPVHLAWDTHPGDSSDPASYGKPPWHKAGVCRVRLREQAGQAG